MSKWVLGPVLALIGAIGLPLGSATAEQLNTAAFTSEASARAYLRTNPTGPLAKAAFLALVEFRLMRENGLSRGQAIAVFGEYARVAPRPTTTTTTTTTPIY